MNRCHVIPSISRNHGFFIICGGPFLLGAKDVFDVPVYLCDLPGSTPLSATFRLYLKQDPAFNLGARLIEIGANILCAPRLWVRKRVRTVTHRSRCWSCQSNAPGRREKKERKEKRNQLSLRKRVCFGKYYGMDTESDSVHYLPLCLVGWKVSVGVCFLWESTKQGCFSTPAPKHICANNWAVSLTCLKHWTSILFLTLSNDPCYLRLFIKSKHI